MNIFNSKERPSPGVNGTPGKKAKPDVQKQYQRRHTPVNGRSQWPAKTDISPYLQPQLQSASPQWQAVEAKSPLRPDEMQARLEDIASVYRVKDQSDRPRVKLIGTPQRAATAKVDVTQALQAEATPKQIQHRPFAVETSPRVAAVRPQQRQDALHLQRLVTMELTSDPRSKSLTVARKCAEKQASPETYRYTDQYTADGKLKQRPRARTYQRPAIVRKAEQRTPNRQLHGQEPHASPGRSLELTQELSSEGIQVVEIKNDSGRPPLAPGDLRLSRHVSVAHIAEACFEMSNVSGVATEGTTDMDREIAQWMPAAQKIELLARNGKKLTQEEIEKAAKKPLTIFETVSAENLCKFVRACPALPAEEKPNTMFWLRKQMNEQLLPDQDREQHARKQDASPSSEFDDEVAPAQRSHALISGGFLIEPKVVVHLPTDFAFAHFPPFHKDYFQGACKAPQRQQITKLNILPCKPLAQEAPADEICVQPKTEVQRKAESHNAEAVASPKQEQEEVHALSIAATVQGEQESSQPTGHNQTQPDACVQPLAEERAIDGKTLEKLTLLKSGGIFAQESTGEQLKAMGKIAGVVNQMVAQPEDNDCTNDSTGAGAEPSADAKSVELETERQLIVEHHETHDVIQDVVPSAEGVADQAEPAGGEASEESSHVDVNKLMRSEIIPAQDEQRGMDLLEKLAEKGRRLEMDEARIDVKALEKSDGTFDDLSSQQ